MKRSFVLLILPAVVGLLAFSVAAVIRPEAFFKKDNTITYEKTEATGLKIQITLLVESVMQNAGTTTIVTKEQQRYVGGKEVKTAYRQTFYADSLNWCADVLNLISIAWKPSSGTKYTSDSLVYPLRMQVGDSLLPASGKEVSEGKKGNDERSAVVTGRRVTGTDEVMIGTEKVSAFRIESVFVFEQAEGKGSADELSMKKQYDLVEWFEPSRGVVKREIRTKFGTITYLLQAPSTH